MNEKALENVLEVREEAHQMLDNLSRVKGDKYARLVKSLLLSSNVMEIYAATASMGGLPDDVRDVLSEAMCKAIYGVMTNMAIAADISLDELNAATRDATTMEASITGLMKTAVVSGIEGSSFGDRGAQ